MQYNYTDSRNNQYLLKDGSIKYMPISKDQSSSGTYDGGTPWTKTLSKKELLTLIDVFERAIWSTEDHTDKRTMGSSCITKPDMDVKLYLKYNSSSQQSVSGILLSFNE